MALPPGCGPILVDGISPDTNPRLAEAAAELNAWIEYLLRPESHDGPRIYKPLRPQNPSEKESEFQERMPYDTIYEQPEDYETSSVLEEFAGDTDRFFRAAQSVSGIRTATIESAYLKLVDGVLTWSRPGDQRMPEPGATGGSGKDQEPWPAPDMKYRDVTDNRINWVNMRKSWVAKEASGRTSTRGTSSTTRCVRRTASTRWPSISFGTGRSCTRPVRTSSP